VVSENWQKLGNCRAALELERTVAVKILPSHLSENPEAKQRFELLGDLAPCQ